jgi:hypothetical protein
VRGGVPRGVQERQVGQLAASPATLDALVDPHGVHDLQRPSYSVFQSGQAVPSALRGEEWQVEGSIEHDQSGTVDDALGNRSSHLVDGLPGIAAVVEGCHVVYGVDPIGVLHRYAGIDENAVPGQRPPVRQQPGRLHDPVLVFVQAGRFQVEDDDLFSRKPSGRVARVCGSLVKDVVHHTPVGGATQLAQ